MVAFIVVAALALLVGGAVLYAKYGKKTEQEVVKLDSFAKTEVGKVEAVAKVVEADVKKVL